MTPTLSFKLFTNKQFDTVGKVAILSTVDLSINITYTQSLSTYNRYYLQVALS